MNRKRKEFDEDEIIVEDDDEIITIESEFTNDGDLNQHHNYNGIFEQSIWYTPQCQQCTTIHNNVTLCEHCGYCWCNSHFKHHTGKCNSCYKRVCAIGASLWYCERCEDHQYCSVCKEHQTICELIEYRVPF